MIYGRLIHVRIKQILVAAILCVTTSILLAELNFPELSGRVVDQANLLSSDTERELTNKLKVHEDETSNQVVVVTLKSLQGYDIADYGYQLGRKWRIGQADKNNGVLLIVAPNDRKVRIEVGYGLENTLTDALSKYIIDNQIIPSFKKKNYSRGIEKGVESIINVLNGSVDKDDLKPQTRSKDEFDTMFFFAFLMIIIVFFLQGHFSLKVTSGIVFFSIVIFGIIVFRSIVMSSFVAIAATIFHVFHIHSASKKSSSDYDDGSHDSGSFGGGGFSGGGGSFGGGGASGGW